MSEQQKATYAKGLYFNTNPENTPDEVKKWKKGSIATHIDNHIEYLNSIREHANEKGYVYHDFTKNEKDGEVFYSHKLNTWKPEVKTEVQTNNSIAPTGADLDDVSSMDF